MDRVALIIKTDDAHNPVAARGQALGRLVGKALHRVGVGLTSMTALRWPGRGALQCRASISVATAFKTGHFTALIRIPVPLKLGNRHGLCRDAAISGLGKALCETSAASHQYGCQNGRAQKT